MELMDGIYQVQGLALTEIAKEFGTPLYVYDGRKIVAQLQNLKNAFSENPLKVKFAMKALSNVSILKLLKKHGAGVDAVSIYEAQLAMRAGFTGDEIQYTPYGVDFSEIEAGVGLGL